MLRNNRVILVSHCVLNQNAVVHPLARAKGPFKTIVELIMSQDFGIIQLACPETLMYGLNRVPMSKTEYDTPAYTSLCGELAEREHYLLKKLVAGGVTVVGIVGIDQSPTCSQVVNTGHFMEALSKHPEMANLPRIDVPESYVVGSTESKHFHEQFKQWLSHL